jgi:Putative viral replication protein.
MSTDITESKHKWSTEKKATRNTRHYAITSFVMEKYEAWETLDIKANRINYLIYQHEICPKTKRDHLQCYVEFENAGHSYDTIKKIFGDDTMHIGARWSTRENCRNYCMKGPTQQRPAKELGEFMVQGQRNDLLAVYEAIKAGATPTEVMDRFPVAYMKYTKAVDRCYANINASRANSWKKVSCTVIQGAAGINKTRSVLAKHGPENVYTLEEPTGDNLWFDGYTGQKVLLIEEFYGGIKYNKLLKLLDGYCMRLDIKGSFVYSNWDHVYITSNNHPDTWYPNRCPDGMTPALERRITDIVSLTRPEGVSHRKPRVRNFVVSAETNLVDIISTPENSAVGSAVGAEGCHSTTNPPLCQLPETECPKLCTKPPTPQVEALGSTKVKTEETPGAQAIRLKKDATKAAKRRRLKKERRARFIEKMTATCPLKCNCYLHEQELDSDSDDGPDT